MKTIEAINCITINEATNTSMTSVVLFVDVCDFFSGVSSSLFENVEVGEGWKRETS